MDKNFVSYIQALALKQLGFDEPCLAVYRGGSLYHNGVGGYYSDGNWDEHKSYGDENQWVSAPLYSQAFDFFREKYDIHSYIDSTYTTGFYLYEYHISTKDSLYGFDTYKEAESACLDKLIDLCKN